MRAATIIAGLALISAAWASATHAAPLTCPAKHQGKAFEGVTVFDGPVEDNAAMRPHEGREVKGKLRVWWNVQDIAKLGREAHVQCHYVGGGSHVMKVAKAAKTCAQQLQRLDNKGRYQTLSFSCQ